MGYRFHKPLTPTQKLKAQLAQTNADLLDAQVALANKKTSNSQRLSDLEEIVATLGGTK